jgi:NADH:ubiquinone oxidoreductase subunit D
MPEWAQQAKIEPEKHENRTKRITIRLTESEYAQVKSEIEVCGLTKAALARQRLLGQRVASRADLAVLAELRRLGGLFKHSYTETGGVYSELTANAIRDISNCVKKITETKTPAEGKEASGES